MSIDFGWPGRRWRNEYSSTGISGVRTTVRVTERATGGLGCSCFVRRGLANELEDDDHTNFPCCGHKVLLDHKFHLL